MRLVILVGDKPGESVCRGLEIAPLTAVIRGLATLLILLAAVGWFVGLPSARAQEPPTHIFSGVVNVDGGHPPDGTAVSAWIDGHVAAKTTVKGGEYTLTVEQPQGES